MQLPKSVTYEDTCESESAKLITDMLEQSGTISVRIRKPLFERVKKLCEKKEVSVNDYVSTAIAMRLLWEEKTKNKEK